MHRILCTTDPINPTKWKNVKGREACQIGRTQQKDESSQIKFTALNAAHADLCLCIIQVPPTGETPLESVKVTLKSNAPGLVGDPVMVAVFLSVPD